MKIIRYQTLNRYNVGTDENPDWREGLGECIMGYNEANLKMAEREAYNGEYTIEDDGTEQVIESSTSEILDALFDT